MKTSCIVFALLASTLTGVQAQVTGTGATATANQPALPAPTAFSPISRDGISTVWERTVYECGTNGTIVPRKSRYTELSTGLNFLQNGQWRPSSAEISLLPPGGAFAAAATQGSHKASFPLDIATGVIQLSTSDGKQLTSRPVGLFYEDNKDSALIALLTNSVGELVGSNQVVYPNAFEGAEASIRYTYTKAGFEQDIVIQGQLPDPKALGLNPARTRLGVLTAFFDTNTPVATPGPVDAADGLSDTTLTFGGKAGGMKMGRGRVFSIGNTEPSPPPASVTPASWLNWMTNAVKQSSSKGTPSYKRWFQLNGRNFLMEEVPYRRVAAQLEQLPPATGRLNPVSTNLFAANSFLDAIPARLLSPPAPGEPDKTQTMRLSRVDWDQTRAVVLDYPVTVTSEADYTFQCGTTYYVSGPCYLGTVHLYGGAVIKYPNVNSCYSIQLGAWNYATAFIEIDGGLGCYISAGQPAIFTAADDDTVGETIDGSTGDPSGNYYANPAIYAPGGITLSDVRIRYAAQGVWAGDGGNITLWNSQVTDSGVMAVLGLGYGYGGPMTLTCNNCLYSGFLYQGYWPAGVVVLDMGSGGDSYNLNNCTIGNVYYMVDGTSSNDNYGCAANSIFANVQNLCVYWTSYDGWNENPNGFYNSYATFGYPQINAYGNPFQTSGGNNYYLADNYPFRNAGTTDIDPDLLAELQTMTTYTPKAGQYADNDGMPDLGYHYPINEDSDCDGIPDWWEMYYFGSFAPHGSDLDGQNHTLLSDYQSQRVPQIILQQPQSQNVYVGQTVVLSVQVINGLTPQYQWKHNGTPIYNATQSSYTIPSVQPEAAGTYTVDVTAGSYTYTSSSAVLNVLIIVQQPMSQNAYVGDSVVLSVQTVNGLNVQYQWKHNGSPISGATSSSYIISSVQSGDGGNYTVDITYGTYVFTSDQALLTISSVIDPNFRGIIGSRTNYTFKSGFTYYIGSNVPLYGNTIIEGGAILKFDWHYYASLHILGTLTCRGGPYQPAILTSLNDDSVGEYVSNDGYLNPNLDGGGYYYTPSPCLTGVPYLEMTDAQSAAISNLWFRFADIGVTTPLASRSLDVWDCQFVDCVYGIVNLVPGTGAVDSLHNVLFSSPYAYSAAIKAGANAINVDAEQITSDTYYFCRASTTPHQINLKNSIIWGNPTANPVAATTLILSTADVKLNPSSANFITVGDGWYYLAPGSSFHNSGTAGISSRLQVELEGKTTSAPLAIAVNTTLTGDMTLSRRAQRYAGGQPDLGYYYDALDYTVANFYVPGGNLTVLPGTAIGIRNDRFQTTDDLGIIHNWWSTEGFLFGSGGSIISRGMPDKPNIFVASDLVQEMPPNTMFVSTIDFKRQDCRNVNAIDWDPAHVFFVTDYENGDPAPPSLDFRFSNFYLPAEDMHIASGGTYDQNSHIGYFSYQTALNLNLRDCQMHNGQICLGMWYPDNLTLANVACSVNWFNNLFENVAINLAPGYDYGSGTIYSDLSFEAYNNLFRGGSFLNVVPIPATAGPWIFKDNLFDKVGFLQFLEYNPYTGQPLYPGGGVPLDYDYNAYWPRSSDELIYSDSSASPRTEGPSGVSLSGPNDRVLASAPPYQAGPYGNYYLPDSAPLHGTGSRTAAAAGLYHYTTRVDQTKEGDDTLKASPNFNVNIGLHYVAADSNGLPKDSDIGGADGIPDYVENWHGDGLRNHTDETDWQAGTDDPNNPIYDDIDLSGNGLVGRIKRALGKNPLDSNNPLTLTQVTTGEEPQFATYEVPISYASLTTIGVLHLLVDGGTGGEFQECDAATDGNCLLKWNTAFDSPGLHYLEARFSIKGQIDSGQTPPTTVLSAEGQLGSYNSINVCQFKPVFSAFNDNGAILCATTPTCPDAHYTIELQTPEGEHIRWLKVGGTTTTGEINEPWDLKYDDDVTPFAGDSCKAIFNVTLDDPGNGSLEFWLHRALLGWDGDFTVAYAWREPAQAQQGGVMWNAIQYSVVDTLLMPLTVGGGSLSDNGCYHSSFNRYTSQDFPGQIGNPGYIQFQTPDERALYEVNLPDVDTMNFYFDGHGSTTEIGTGEKDSNLSSDKRIHIPCNNVAKMLGNKLDAKGDWVQHPYRFVFLNACDTAGDSDWAHAFGIPDKITSADLASGAVMPQAFLGWHGDSSAPESDDDWNQMAITYSVFWDEWMNDTPLSDCVEMARSKNPYGDHSVILQKPLGIYTGFFPMYKINAANYRCYPMIYGYPGITRDSYIPGYDGNYQYNVK